MRRRAGSTHTNERAGTGNTTLATHTGWLAVAVLVAVCGVACSRAGAAAVAEAPVRPTGPDGGHVSAPRVKSTDAGVTDGAALPIVEEGDCPAICEKLLRCKQGPWKKPADCQDACEASNEDAISGRTYRCVAKAKSCSRMKKCTR
jgi:hypothetical protein